MRGDFSDVKFDPRNHFSRVLKQQGRVQLDSDDNEQTEILLHYLRTFTADLLHRAGAGYSAACPASMPDSFKIDLKKNPSGVTTGLTVSPGRYYVEGILCELDATGPIDYADQPDYLLGENAGLPDAPFLVYLDVWERFISAAENDSIREVALGGPDTTGRSRVVWQIRTAATQAADCAQALLNLTASFEAAEQARLRARAAGQTAPEGLCVVPPQARYRGEENALYRVEIHRGGLAWDGVEGIAGNAATAATFVWSRDNGSNVFPIASFGGEEVTLETLGRDARTGLQEGDIVEVQYEGYVLGDTSLPPALRNPPPLLEVAAIDRDAFRVKLEGDLDVVDGLRDSATILRRWDRRPGAATAQSGLADDGATLIVESTDEEEGWIELENGIEVQFAPSAGGTPTTYRSGDYWLIPARAEIGDVRWPRALNGDSLPEPSRGVAHHYAPLALVTAAGITDCRTSFELTSKSPPQP